MVSHVLPDTVSGGTLGFHYNRSCMCILSRHVSADVFENTTSTWMSVHKQSRWIVPFLYVTACESGDHFANEIVFHKIRNYIVSLCAKLYVILSSTYLHNFYHTLYMYMSCLQCECAYGSAALMTVQTSLNTGYSWRASLQGGSEGALEGWVMS